MIKIYLYYAFLELGNFLSETERGKMMKKTEAILRGCVPVIGTSGGGVSSLANRLIKNIFETPVEEEPFEAGGRILKIVTHPCGTIKLTWEHQEKKQDVSAKVSEWSIKRMINYGSFGRGSVALLVFDVTDEKSFEGIQKIYCIVKKKCPAVNVVLVGTKIDLEIRKEFDLAVERFADISDTPYYTVSAKTGEGIPELKSYIAEAIANQKNKSYKYRSKIKINFCNWIFSEKYKGHPLQQLSKNPLAELKLVPLIFQFSGLSFEKQKPKGSEAASSEEVAPKAGQSS